jgi:hypothetical protein
MFIAPNWLEGLLIQAGIYIGIPLIIAVILGLVRWKKLKNKPHHKAYPDEPYYEEPYYNESKKLSIALTFALAFMVSAIVMYPLGSVYWWSAYEVPSVQEKIITVQGWEPKAGMVSGDYGGMVISNADQLMLVAKDGEGFFNNENFLFQKFNTRDIFNQLKVGGTYKIKYYGWRNGYNSGFPNILSVEQVINETNTTSNDYNKYFGTKFAY